MFPAFGTYKNDGDTDARDALILNYSPLVKYVAGRLASSLPQTVDTADLISYGIFGLIDAIEKFDLGRAIKFETYAIARIKGAIIDELRAMDWVPRSVRSRAREIEDAYIALENQLKRFPSDAEVAEHMGVTTKELADILTKLSYTSVVSFEELWVGGDRDDGQSAIGSIKDDTADDPVAIFESEEIKSHPRRGDRPPSRAREDRHRAVLLRGPDAQGDRPGSRRDRVARARSSTPSRSCACAHACIRRSQQPDSRRQIAPTARIECRGLFGILLGL